ncbi:MAG: hypothetical protein GWP91_21230 [Rhodobacterales bacterium]|nr:hypothetical protein [Rhodobacterales bacterium]
MSGEETKGLEDTTESDVESHRMPLMEHLIELRNRMMWSIGALILGVGVSFGFAEHIYI